MKSKRGRKDEKKPVEKGNDKEERKLARGVEESERGGRKRRNKGDREREK